jgi:hypothetical protein
MVSGLGRWLRARALLSALLDRRHRLGDAGVRRSALDTRIEFETSCLY